VSNAIFSPLDSVLNEQEILEIIDIEKNAERFEFMA
jgi:hypothetical protein